MKKQFTKSVISIIVALVTFLTYSISAAGANFDFHMCVNAEQSFTVDDAVKLITLWEEAYERLMHTGMHGEYWVEGAKSENVVLYVRDADKNSDAGTYRSFEEYIIVSPFDTYDKNMEFLTRIFTLDMAKEVLNDSILLFKNGKAYNPGYVTSPAFKLVLSETGYGAPELKDRITVTDLENGNKRIYIKYFDPKDNEEIQNGNDKVSLENAKTVSVEVTKTESGYRICKHDTALFKYDSYAADGKRKFRVEGEDDLNSLFESYLSKNNNPQTADLPVIAIFAAAILSVCFAAVLFTKKQKYKI